MLYTRNRNKIREKNGPWSPLGKLEECRQHHYFIDLGGRKQCCGQDHSGPARHRLIYVIFVLELGTGLKRTGFTVFDKSG